MPITKILTRQREPLIDLRDHPLVPLARLARTKDVLHIQDLATDRAYLDRDHLLVSLVELAGARTLLSVPMLKDGELVGSSAPLFVRWFAAQREPRCTRGW